MAISRKVQGMAIFSWHEVTAWPSWSLIDWSCRWDETYVSEPHPLTGLLFIPRVICGIGKPWWWWWWWWRWLLTRTPALCGNPTSRDIWGRIGGMDEGLRISQISIWDTSTDQELRHGSSGFSFPPKEGVLRIFVALAGFEPATLGWPS
jgi:hypothetical protein